MPDYTTNIQDYLEGRLDKEEQQAFEAQLLRDEGLKQAVAEHRVAYEAVDLLVQKKLKQDLRAMQVERQQKGRFTKRRWLLPAVAASILLLLAAGFYFNLRGQYSDSALVAQNFEAYSSSNIRGIASDGLKKQAFEAYELKRYDEALALFDKVVPTTMDIVFFKGIAALELQKNEASIAYFLKVIESQDPQFAEAAQWYQALAFLQNHQETMARKVLSAILGTSDHGYQGKAKQLLEDLDAYWR